MCFAVGMSNETHAGAAKSFLLSKTFWVNLVALVSLIAPQVREWLAANPVEFMAVLGAVNLILRFVTKGSVAFSRDGNDEDKTDGASGGALPIGMLLVVGLVLLPALPSCSSDYPLSGSISYRDPDTGAKGGLTFTPDGQEGFIRVPIIDPDSGEQIGLADLRVPIKGAVKGTK